MKKLTLLSIVLAFTLIGCTTGNQKSSLNYLVLSTTVETNRVAVPKYGDGIFYGCLVAHFEMDEFGQSVSAPCPDMAAPAPIGWRVTETPIYHFSTTEKIGLFAVKGDPIREYLETNHTENASRDLISSKQ